MKIKLTLTEDHIKLISSFHINKLDDEHYGIDVNNMWGGTYLYEQMAFILGYEEYVIPETKDDPEGPRYVREYEEKMIEYDEFITENLQNIEELIHQFSCKGGLTPGVYSCLDYVRIWKKE